MLEPAPVQMGGAGVGAKPFSDNIRFSNDVFLGVY